MVPTAPTWTKPAPSLSGQSAPTFAPLSPVHTQQPEVLLKRQSDHTSPLLTVLQWFFMTLRAIAKVPSMPPTQDLGCHLSDLTTYLSPIAHPTLATLTTSCARTHCLSSPLASQFQMATLPFPLSPASLNLCSFPADLSSPRCSGRWPRAIRGVVSGTLTQAPLWSVSFQWLPIANRLKVQTL